MHWHDCLPPRIEFLRVRWFANEKNYHFGDKFFRQERVGFVSEVDDLLGFVDPALVVRRAHIIPAFNFGASDTILSPSLLARVNPHESATEYHVAFYVNRSVPSTYMCIIRLTVPNRFDNRDLYMRNRGGGIGHVGIRKSLASAHNVSSTLFKRADDK